MTKKLFRKLNLVLLIGFASLVLGLTGCQINPDIPQNTPGTEKDNCTETTSPALSIQGLTFRRGIALKASDAYNDTWGELYMTVSDNGTVAMRKTSVGERETFYMVNLGSSPDGGKGLFALWSRSKQKYVRVDYTQPFWDDDHQSWGAPAYADASSAGTGEIFDYFAHLGVIKPHLESTKGGTWWYNNNGCWVVGTSSDYSYYAEYQIKTNAGYPTAKVALRSYLNGKYVCADLEYGSDAPLYANRSSRGQWETFDLIDLGSNQVMLRAYANANYVSADFTTRATANWTGAIGDFETFDIVFSINGTIGLRSHANGKFLRNDSFRPDNVNMGSGSRFYIEPVQ